MNNQIFSCSLSSTEQVIVLAGYAAAAKSYTATVGLDGHEARVSLRGDQRTLRSLVDQMIAQETRCCSFLEFDRRETADGVEVRVSIRESLPAEIEPSRLEQFVRAVFPTAAIVID